MPMGGSFAVERKFKRKECGCYDLESEREEARQLLLHRVFLPAIIWQLFRNWNTSFILLLHSCRLNSYLCQKRSQTESTPNASTMQ